MTYAVHCFFLIYIYQLNDRHQSSIVLRVCIFCPYLGFGHYIAAISANKMACLQNFADMSCFVGFARINIIDLDLDTVGRVLKFDLVTVGYVPGLDNVNVCYVYCPDEIDSCFVRCLDVNFSYVR